MIQPHVVEKRHVIDALENNFSDPCETNSTDPCQTNKQVSFADDSESGKTKADKWSQLTCHCKCDGKKDFLLSLLSVVSNILISH